jgi:hypothetical protein
MEWNGDAIEARVDRAVRAGIDDTTQDIDDDATVSHWWENRDLKRYKTPAGFLEREIVTTPSFVDGDRIVGRVGVRYSGEPKVKTAFYGLFLEYKQPWLRPAFDRQAHRLAMHIRDRFNR